MSKATYWQRGESLDYKNKTASVIEENTIVIIGSRIGVTGAPVNPGETGPIHVSGVFEIAKAAGQAIDLGTEVYFDGEKITTTKTDNTLAGYAAADAASSDAKVLVKLLG